jgi:hypothetical protein
MTTASRLLLAASMLLAVRMAPAADTVVGWMNDGSGHFPGQRIVDSWDVQTRKNILWAAPMPNWSNSSPIVLDGRVYLMSEPVDYAPILMCLDAETGKERWRREVDTALTYPSDRQQEVRQLLSEAARWQRQLRSALAWYRIEPKPADLKERWKPIGVTEVNPRKGFQAVITVNKPHPYADVHKQLKQMHLQPDRWTFAYGAHGRPKANTNGTWTGLAYPTPVSDGRNIWVLTAHNIIACYNTTGELVWIRRFPHPRDVKLTAEQEAWLESGKFRSARSWTSKVPGDGSFSTSPVLVDGRLVVNAGGYVRALDARSGRTLWEVPNRFDRAQSMSVPQIADLPTPNGKTIRCVVTGAFGEVFRLDNGAHVGGNLTQPTKGLDAIRIFNGHYAVTDFYKLPARGLELSIGADGKLQEKVLWEKKKVGRLGRFPWRLVIVDGKGVADKGVVDLMTGQVVVDDLRSAHAGHVWSMRVVAGKQMLQGAGDTGKFCVRHVLSNNGFRESQIPLDPKGGVPEELKQGSAASPTWEHAGAATPFIYKNRIYYRAYDFLWCIGQR